MSSGIVAVFCAAMATQITAPAGSAVAGEPGTMQTDSSRDRARREPAPDTGLLYHLTWYGADYAVVAALAGVGFGLAPLLEPSPALWGPRFDDANPDFSLFDDPYAARHLGAPFHEDTVSELSIYIAIGALTSVGLGYDGLRHRDWHRAHNLLLGTVESMLLTFTVTELLKRGVGRLRPDFQDRATRYYCNPEVGRRDLPGIDCSQVDADGVYLDEKELERGHSSFPSGHSSSAFALATFFALYVGGETIWGDHATTWSAPAGAVLMTGLLGLATTVAATRITDGRHHIDDVAAGAAIGASASALFYFLHFDLRGQATYRGLAVSPVALDEGMGVSLAWAL